MTLIWSFLFVALSSRGCCSIEQKNEQCVDCADNDSTESDDDALTYLASIRSVSIPSQAIHRRDGITFYTIVLSLLEDESVVSASHRYNEFAQLMRELTLIPFDGKFPKKKWLPDSVCKRFKPLRTCVEDRRLWLEAYLGRAISHIIRSTADSVSSQYMEERRLQARTLTKFMSKRSDDTAYEIHDDYEYYDEHDDYDNELYNEQDDDDDVDIDEPVAEGLQGSFSKDALINEYYDTNMGIAFSMVSKTSWEWGGSWGLASDPNSVPDGKRRFVSIMTHKQDMSTYTGTAYGLAFHITPESNFWKYFLAIKGGKKAGGICGGPGDGGSHTPPHLRVLPESMGLDYEWFTREKKRILDKYNTVYKIHDYNEFITMGTSKIALAGIFHYTRRRKYILTDEQMCDTLRTVRGGQWPIYAYDRKSLSIERYLNC